MVALTTVEASNASISTALPANLNAVFVGGTSGIGEFTLRDFVQKARSPRVVLVGRSQEAADRILADCKATNPDAELTFIRADVSLVKVVDDVSRQIRAKFGAINLLVQSQGSLGFDKRTEEDVNRAGALINHSRLRFIANLLPQLQAATALRRVVSVFAGTKEGPLDDKDMSGQSFRSPMAGRGHATSMQTLSLETLAARAPSVSFVHSFPGPVKTGIGRDMQGPLMSVAKVLFSVMFLFTAVPAAESGARHLYAATSAAFPAAADAASCPAVPLGKGAAVARGTDGTAGSGVYVIDQHSESGDDKVVATLAELRRKGLREKVWKYIEGDFERITGSLSI